VKPPRETPHASEKNLSTACIKRFRKEWGGEVLNVHGGGTSQAAGHPDLLGCLRGRFVACELKQPGKVPTPLQMKRLRDWGRAGALIGWVTTEVEFDELLSHHGDLEWVNPQFGELVPRGDVSGVPCSP
jgi:hypothetical protein